MKTVAQKIKELVISVKSELLNLPLDTVYYKSSPVSWSKIEILGHLIDSASNNHQRIVRAVQNIASDFPVYNQNIWVEIQNYNQADWIELVEFFTGYNLHIARIIRFVPKESLTNPCNFGKENDVPLEFVISDYLRHLKHHIEKILEPININQTK